MRVGIKPDSKVIARGNTKIYNDKNQEIGKVTSGTFGPSVEHPIAMGYVDNSYSTVNTKIFLEVRGKKFLQIFVTYRFIKKITLKGKLMSEVKYSKEHEWIKLDGDEATIGITKHATEMLGDIVFAELPEKGSNVDKDGTAGVVESTKAASDVYTPVSGEVIDTNQMIVDDPSKINEDPEESAWFFKLKIKDKSEMDSLMSKEEYEKFAKESSA